MEPLERAERGLCLLFVLNKMQKQDYQGMYSFFSQRMPQLLKLNGHRQCAEQEESKGGATVLGSIFHMAALK